jgi:hypothetical protein
MIAFQDGLFYEPVERNQLQRATDGPDELQINRFNGTLLA